MFRVLLFGIDFIFLLLASLICWPLKLVIGLFDKKKRDYFCLGFIKFAMKNFLLIGGAKVTYKGLEYLPEKGDDPVVFIGNHRGFFDVVATYAVMKGLTGFVAKQEMKTWPLIGWWMVTGHCLFLDRENKRSGLETILKGIENVKNGISMAIYPEGTRSKVEGVMGEFHGGSFKLATKSKAKIIPVVANNSSAVWEDHSPWLKSAKMSIEFLEPIDTASLAPAELNALPEKLHDIILKKTIENGKALGSLPEDFGNEQ